MLLIIILALAGGLFLTINSVRRGASDALEIRVTDAPVENHRLRANDARWSQRQNIFVAGARYRVKIALPGPFAPGDVVTYQSASYNNFARAWGYVFAGANNDKTLWNLPDDAAFETWQDYFEPA